MLKHAVLLDWASRDVKPRVRRRAQVLLPKAGGSSDRTKGDRMARGASQGTDSQSQCTVTASLLLWAELSKRGFFWSRDLHKLSPSMQGRPQETGFGRKGKQKQNLMSQDVSVGSVILLLCSSK